jgi:hypothetical protein
VTEPGVPRGLATTVAWAVLALAAQGWFASPARGGDVIFEEDFSGSAPTGLHYDREKVWSVWNGHLRAILPDAKQQRSFAYFGSPDWKDYSVDLDVCGLRGVDKVVAVRVEGTKAVVVDLRGPGLGDVIMYRGYTRLGRHEVECPNGTWNHLRIEAQGPRYRVFVNGQLAIEFSERRNKRPRGRLALVAYTGGAGECEVVFDNVVVRALP